MSRSIDTDTGINMGIDALPISPRVHRTPSGLNMSSVSSRAEVEALVQRAQQSVLDMAVDLEENTRRDQGTGRTALSLKLAMFGESLAMERRMKEEEDAVGRGVLLVDAGTTPVGYGLGVGERSLLSSSRPQGAELSFSRSRNRSGASSEDTSLQHNTRITPDEIRRTASADFRRTMSDSPVDGMPRTSDNTRRTRSPLVAPPHLPPVHHDPNQHPHPLPLPSPRTQKSFETFAYTPPRSRTPDPYDANANEDTEVTGLGMGFGIPLSRISTAPTRARRISTTRNAPTTDDVSTTRNISPSKRNISSTAARNIPTTVRNASPAGRTTSSSTPRDMSSTPVTRSVNKLSRMGVLDVGGVATSADNDVSATAEAEIWGDTDDCQGVPGEVGVSLVPMFRGRIGLGCLVTPCAYVWQASVHGQSLLIRRCVVCFPRVLVFLHFDVYSLSSLSLLSFLLLLFVVRCLG
ncbi:hypothetical protein BDR07DRAFT_244699 [Suillus spraguei]|nr:hypothetical protein BDR07DRAFT_244699 [Suillus spraguei]